MIKMNDFEQGLANIMGSFMEVNLDCVEKQNQEIEQLQNNWNELKKTVERMKEDRELKGDFERFTAYDFVLNKMQELEGNNE